MNTITSKQRGYLILTAVIIITAIAFFASTIVYMYLASTESGAKLVSSERAYYMAQSGIERSTYGFLVENITCAQINATNSTFTNVPFVDGQFSVVGNANIASSTLSAGVDASVTTIPVTSTTGFSSNTGIAVIEQEIILYSGLNANALLGVVRGSNGTTAVAHSNSAVVTQNNCLLTSVGTVSGINGSSNVTLQRAVSKATAGTFIVGNNGLILKKTDTSWVSVTSGTTVNLNDVFMYTPSDGWAVGNVSGGQSTILHWNGTSFSAVANPGTANLRGIWAVSANEAWAVGDNNLVMKWNGAQWSIVAIPIGSTDFYSISIIDSNGDGIGDFGYAVGTGGRIVKFNSGIWVDDESPTTENLRKVWVIAATGDGAFACGNEAALRWREEPGVSKWFGFKINGSVMNALVTADTSPADGIHDFIYMAGTNGTLITWHTGASSWPNLVNTGADVTGLAAISATQILAIGSVSGTYKVLSWDGVNTWVDTGYMTNTPLNAIGYVGGATSHGGFGFWDRVYN